MKTIDNPFTLSFGKKPGAYISRFENTEKVISAFSSAQPLSQAFMIEGIRGSGKTVLMTAIASALAEDPKWIVCDLNSGSDLVEDFMYRLSDAMAVKLTNGKRGFSVSAAGVGISANTTSELRDNVSHIEEMLEKATKQKKRILITIDEVQHDQKMREFAGRFQIWIRKDYPIYLLMTGLYENMYAVQNDPALTFLLRAPKIRLEPLSMFQICTKYKEILQVSDEKAREMSLLTKGYAFAFQALGVLCWNAGKKSDVDSIIKELDLMLDDFVYKKIWDTLSAQDRRVLKAFNAERMRIKDLCEAIPLPTNSLSKYRERLMGKGILISDSRGYLSMALPRFLEIIQYYE